MIKRFVFLILMLTTAGIAYAETGPITREECRESLSNPETEASRTLNILEKELFVYKRNVYRYMETYYRPFWEARQMMSRDPGSDEQISGRVLYGRYEHELEGLTEGISASSGKIMNRIEDIKGYVFEVSGHCRAWDYQDCAGVWRDQVSEILKVMENEYRSFEKQNQMFLEVFSDTLYENPSEHTDFGERFGEYFLTWEVRLFPLFSDFIRKLRGFLETHSVSNKCCIYCSKDNVEHASNHLSNVLIPDPDASYGVRGNVVGHSNLELAFDNLREASES